MAAIELFITPSELTDESNLTTEELIALEKRHFYTYEWEMGLKLAREQGIKKGRELVRQRNIQEIVPRLFPRMDDEKISELLEIPLDKIQALRREWEAQSP